MNRYPAILIYGPVVIVSVCYGICESRLTGRQSEERGFPQPATRQRPVPNEFAGPGALDRPHSAANRSTVNAPVRAVPIQVVDFQSLRSQCSQLAAQIRDRHSGMPTVVIDTPFVLVSDLPSDALRELSTTSIRPIASALQSTFDLRPIERPFTIVLFADPERFRRFVGQTAGSWYARYYGFYLRQHRRVVVSLQSGEGTLAHELTHALIGDDHPGIPEWLDEGLASLFEESEVRSDGARIRGLANWRSAVLADAARRGSELDIHRLLETGRIDTRREGLDYALARQICLVLQRDGRLVQLYHWHRSQAGRDPSGIRALRSVIAPESIAQFNTRILFQLDPPSSKETPNQLVPAPNR